MPFSASSCVRRLAIRSASVLMGRYSYACDCRILMNSASSSASDWYADALVGSGMNSATTVLSALTATGS